MDESRLHQLELDLVQSDGRLKAIEQELQHRPPWYRQMSGIVSVAAFVISTSSTLHACQRDALLDRQQARATLNTLSQRLLALPREIIEVELRYGNTRERSAIGSLLNAEGDTMINTMQGLMKRYPSIVTSVDQYVLAFSLERSGRISEAIPVYEQAAAMGEAVNPTIASYRALGAAYFATGRREKGRQAFRAATEVIPPRSTALDPESRSSVNQFSYLLWSIHEAQARDCPRAQETLQKALLLRPYGNPHQGLIDEARQALASCRGGLPDAPDAAAAGPLQPPAWMPSLPTP